MPTTQPTKSSCDLSRAILAELNKIPLANANIGARILDASTTVFTASNVSYVMIINENGSEAKRASDLYALRQAFDWVERRAMACAISGKGMQGPLLLDSEGQKWAPLSIHYDPDSRFICFFLCRQVDVDL